MRDALVVPHILRKMMESPVPLDIDKGVFNKFLQQLAAELQPRGLGARRRIGRVGVEFCVAQEVPPPFDRTPAREIDGKGGYRVKCATQKKANARRAKGGKGGGSAAYG